MAGIKERLIQVVLRGKDLLSPEAQKGKEALEALRTEGEKLRAELDKAKAGVGLVKAIDSLNKEAARTEKALDRARADVDQLRDALDKAPGSKGLAASLRAAESESRRAEKALDKLQDSIKEQSAEAKKAGVDVTKLSAEEKRLAGELERTKGAVDRNAKATRDLQKEQAAAARSAAEQENRTKSLRSALVGAEKRVLAYAAAYISLKAAMGAVTGVVGFVKNGFTAIFASAIDSEQKLAQLNATLTASGERAGWTAEQLINMANELRSSSMFTAEEVMQGQTKLLSYANITGEQLPQAMQMTIDFAQRMGMTVEQAAERIGRSLNKPSNAMGVLGRRGFDLSASQQELVKTLESTGRTAEAQAIVMDRLSETWGGAAAAARYDTFAGLWRGITNLFEDFQNKVADSGSFEYIREALNGLHDTLYELANDGTLDNLAEAVSDAFVQGAEKVRELAGSLKEVDFKRLADDSSSWLRTFGEQIDDALLRVKLFFAPFRTLLNGFTTGISMMASGVTGLITVALVGLEKVASAWHKLFGGTDYSKSIREAAEVTAAMTSALLEQIEQDGKDIRNAWSMNADHAIDEKKREADTLTALERKKALDAKQAAEEAAAAQEAAAEEAVNAYRLAAIEGTRAFEDMAEALDIIDATDSIEELEKFRETLLQMGRDGTLAGQELDSAISTATRKIAELSRGGKDAAKDLATLEGVMQAIKTAANDIDVRQAKAALDKLYREGKIDAQEHEKAQLALNNRVADMKPAADKAKQSMAELGDTINNTNITINQTTEEVSAAGAMFAWFAGWIDKVREPLRNMSAEALAAFDNLRGINKEPVELDTSSWEKTTEAARNLRNEAGQLRSQIQGLANSSFGLSNWAYGIRADSAMMQAAFLEQKASVQQLVEQYESGAISMQAFIAAANKARDSSDLLGESDLSPLVAAIDAAKQKMDQLASSSKSTLEQLNDELLQLKGTQEEIEASRMASRRRDLQSQLAEAQKAGDQTSMVNLQQALRTLSEIEDERVRQARNAKAEEAKKAAEEKTQKSAQPASAAQAPQKLIRLEAPGGRGVNVSVGSDKDEAALLDILEQYAMRTH